MRLPRKVRIFLARRDLPARHDWLADRMDFLGHSLTYVEEAMVAIAQSHEHHYRKLRSLIMASFAEVSADLDVVTNGIADGYEKRDALIAELRSAVAAGDLVKAQALADQDAQHAAVLAAAVDRLRGLGQDAENPVPDTTPLPEAPAVEVPGNTAPVDEAPADETPVDVPVEDAPVTDEGTEQV